MNWVFGKKHFSFRCFLVSSVFSAVFFTLIFIALMLSNDGSSMFAQMVSGSPLLLFLSGVLLNVPGDYLALLETRWILARRIHTAWKIILDFFITYVLSLSWIALLTGLYFGLKAGLATYVLPYINPFDIPIGLQYGDLPEKPEEVIFTGLFDMLLLYLITLRVVLATSYVTSAWLWLYGASDLTARFLSKNAKLIHYLNIENKPARALGLVSSLLFFLFGSIAFLLYRLLS